MKENAIGGAAAGLYLRHPTNARGRLHRSAPKALAGDPASGPVPRMLTGRGRFAQLGARRLPEGSTGARAAPSGASAGPSALPVGLQRGAHVIRAHRMMVTDTGRTEAPSLGERWEMPFRPRHVQDPPPPRRQRAPKPTRSRGPRWRPGMRPITWHARRTRSPCSARGASAPRGLTGCPSGGSRVPQQASLRGPSGCCGARTSSARTA
jgi:hypothetical protein